MLIFADLLVRKVSREGMDLHVISSYSHCQVIYGRCYLVGEDSQGWQALDRTAKLLVTPSLKHSKKNCDLLILLTENAQTWCFATFQGNCFHAPAADHSDSRERRKDP
jgi:hypothetical protein